MRMMPQREGFAFSLYEKWDLQAVQNILSRPCSLLNEDGEFDGKLQKLLQNINAGGNNNTHVGIVNVAYHSRKEAVLFNIQGRVYGQGFQGVPRWVRRLCANKYYHDVDIVNCFPVILLQLQEKVGVNMDPIHLRQYVEDREGVLKADMQIVQGLTREEAKLQYLKVMFGGELLEYQTPFLRRYKTEINYITEHLWHLQEYCDIRRYAESRHHRNNNDAEGDDAEGDDADSDDTESNRQRKKNVKASFLSVVINTVERKIMNVAMDRVSRQDMGYTVGSYVFDGFMVEKKSADASALPDEFHDELSRVVLEKTGYEVEFVEKSLKPSVADIERIYPAFNNMISNCDANPPRVFTELSMLARDLNSEPKPENVQLFKNVLVPIMNKAFARLQTTVALVVVRRVSNRGPNDVKYDRMKIGDVQSNYKHETFNIDTGEKKECVVPIVVWLNSRYALNYDGMTFNPRGYEDPRCAPPNLLNTFIGLAYPQKRTYTAEEMVDLEENELKPFWDHVDKVWCRGNPLLFDYIKHWIWSKVTRPWYHLESALILQSDEGAGKGVIVEKMCEVIGIRYMSKPPSLQSITGNTFNRQYFENCLVMFLDEAFYAGSKATKNQVKTIITDKYISVNEKFMPQFQVENFLSMVLASNEDHVVNRDVKSRRYLNLSLSNEYAGIHSDTSVKRKYFDAIWNVDPQVLSDYLHSMEVVEWRGTDIPTTLEGEEQAVLSFDSRQAFVHNIMVEPLSIQEARLEYQKFHPDIRHTFELAHDSDHLAGTYVKQELYNLYVDQSRGGFTFKRPQFFEYLEKFVPCIRFDTPRKRIHGKYYRMVYFPKLEVARQSYKDARGLLHTVFPAVEPTQAQGDGDEDEENQVDLMELQQP